MTKHTAECDKVFQESQGRKVARNCPACQHGQYPMMGGGNCDKCNRPVIGLLDRIKTT